MEMVQVPSLLVFAAPIQSLTLAAQANAFGVETMQAFNAANTLLGTATSPTLFNCEGCNRRCLIKDTEMSFGETAARRSFFFRMSFCNVRYWHLADIPSVKRLFLSLWPVSQFLAITRSATSISSDNLCPC